MPLIDLGDHLINVRQWGEGEPLLLVHGLGTNSDVWRGQIPALSRRFRVIAIDLRGFGRSTVPPGPLSFTFDAVVDDIVALCRKLDLAPIHYVGTSMGGFIGQALALREPDLCRTLSLCFTAAHMAIPADVLTSRLEALRQMSMDDYGALIARQALAQPADPIVEEWLSEMIAKNDRDIYVHFLAKVLNGFDVTERVGTIRIPTLILSGSDDRIIPPERGAELHAMIAGSEFRLIEGVGHIGYAERADVVTNHILDFLERQESLQTRAGTATVAANSNA